MKTNLKIYSQVKVPTIMVIFGATGDLSKKKLLPSLLDLYSKGLLPNKFKIVASSNKNYSDKEFREYVKRTITKSGHGHKHKTILINKFVNCIYYLQGDFKINKTYKELLLKINIIEDSFKQCTNKLFYLAVPPVLFKTITSKLSSHKLTKPCSDKVGWTRILIEKPFGKDIKSAQKLDLFLGKLFREEQIYRIDHYLAKETVQNLLTFRFSNTLFEPIWNNKFIEKVEIELLEKNTVANRGNFYNLVGALTDVGQNHILQMLALIAMDNPNKLEANGVRTKRLQVFKSLRTISRSQIKNFAVRGQYQGYKKEKGVAKDSKTETYFKIKASINNNRWKGVPFYLESGKALNENKTEIKIHFKKSKCLCPPQVNHPHQNTLTFRIQPEESIKIDFWTKMPGFSFDLEKQNLHFIYKEAGETDLSDAYERVLFDAIAGDLTLFTSTEEVIAEWKFITPILKFWKKIPLHFYKKGSTGPKANI